MAGPGDQDDQKQNTTPINLPPRLLRRCVHGTTLLCFKTQQPELISISVSHDERLPLPGVHRRAVHRRPVHRRSHQRRARHALHPLLRHRLHACEPAAHADADQRRVQPVLGHGQPVPLRRGLHQGRAPERRRHGGWWVSAATACRTSPRPSSPRPPSTRGSWVANAVSSLTVMINKYGLDGVDVDYEHFATGTDVNTFVECIGCLLTQLKTNMPWITTSIAPFEDPTVQRYYQPLWRKYNGVIDYFNFQFYGYGANTDVPLYLQFYNNQSANYPGGKVLASFMTGNTTGLISPDLGINAAKELQWQNKLPGLFIWSADSSKKSSYGFKYEIQGQQIIANH